MPPPQISAYHIRQYQIALVAAVAKVPREVVLALRESELDRAMGFLTDIRERNQRTASTSPPISRAGGAGDLATRGTLTLSRLLWWNEQAHRIAVRRAWEANWPTTIALTGRGESRPALDERHRAALQKAISTAVEGRKCARLIAETARRVANPGKARQIAQSMWDKRKCRDANSVKVLEPSAARYRFGR